MMVSGHCKRCGHPECDHALYHSGDGGPCGWCNNEWASDRRSLDDKCLSFERNYMEKRYCVIGKASSYDFERRWAGTELEATEHAKDLIRSKAGSNNNLELYVVKVVAVVKKAVPPIEVTRLE